MCGIFGAIGRNFNPHIFRSLAIANRDRGHESFGCFASKDRSFKQAGDPVDIIGTPQFCSFLERMAKGSWFLCGHTRYSTRGSGKVTDNAHPFKYGNYTGVHNGVISSAPMRYTVDSMFIWDQLNDAKGDYQKAWEEMRGNWGLAWTDGKYVYLQTYHQVLSLCVGDDNVYYFSSDADHLRAATGVQDIIKMSDGDTLKFLPNGSLEELTKLKVKEYTYVSTHNHHEWSGYKHNACGGFSSTSAADANVRMIGIFNKDTNELEYIPKAQYHERRAKEAEKITTAPSDLTDVDLANFCDEWETYMQFEEPELTNNPESDTILEIEDATGLIVVEETNDAQKQETVAN
jgi:hypothetical protein